MNQHSRARSGGIPRLRPQAIPALSYGFRPFFFSAALWAAVAMVLWLGLLSGWWTFANGYGAIAWHAHEFLFGYIAAVMTGFLLTAIPNWTGRLPLQGMPLLVLLVLWLAGRAAMLATDQIGTSAATLIDCAYLVTLTAIITREIVAGSNWRNLRVAVLVALTAVANIVFQAEVLIHAGPNYGLHLAVAAIVALIMVVGGRVTPSFTSNWLTRQGSQTRPAPMGRFDIGAIAIGTIALAAWIAAPDWYGAAALLVVMAIAHAARLSRWAGARTWREPMLFVLHLGYAFVPLGALLLSTSIVWPRIVPARWRAPRLDDRRNGDNDTCDHDARDAWTYRSRCAVHSRNDRNLWRYAAGWIGAYRSANAACDLLRGAAHRRVSLAPGVRYFPFGLRANAVRAAVRPLSPAINSLIVCPAPPPARYRSTRVNLSQAELWTGIQ